MAEVNLASNEGIILQSTSVMSGSVWAAYTDELILTNLNVILIKRGILGNKKNEQRFPISQIKKVNGKPQVMLGQNSLNGSDQLHITFTHGVEWFEFQSNSKKEIVKWIEAIYELFNCVREDKEEKGVFTSTLKKGVDSIKNILSIKSENETTIKNIKCSGCKAPLTGKPGQVVKCIYCDTKHTF